MSPLWSPSAPERTALDAFRRLAAERTGRALPDYDALWAWSVEDTAAFWDLWREASGVVMTPALAVLESPTMPGAVWFRGATLNFAENLLRHRSDVVALVALDEAGRRTTLTYAQLAERAGRLAGWLRARGVVAGDRIAAFVSNREEAVIAMLASTWLGAVWTSCSPDFGHQGVMDRFGQIAPKVLFATDGYVYGAKVFDTRDRVESIVRALPSVQVVVVIPTLGRPIDGMTRSVAWDDATTDEIPDFVRFPFDHPLYILYSSGTTGVPKCIVHGVGGTLLQHTKEHILHCDFGGQDVVFWFTTTGWMMWNWLVSGLFTGATLVLWDGNPAWPDLSALWRMAEREGVTWFGTSPRFLASCHKAEQRPCELADLRRMRTLGSTGSPLPPDMFSYIGAHVGPVQVVSICGGTDIVSCFMLGCPTEPVYSGEIQKRALGMAVAAFDEDGQAVVGQKGELVCTKAAPSMPIGFLNDPDGSSYRNAYFTTWPGVWHHGDFVEITPNGGVVVYGRSDATLNPGGVRIGTSEIMRQVEGFEEVIDSLVIGQEWLNDVRIVLFVVLRAGLVLDRDLQDRIRASIRKGTTPRHVPGKILQAPAIPRTLSGKSVEIAVSRVVHGRPVKNRDALANPEALDWFSDRPELRR